MNEESSSNTTIIWKIAAIAWGVLILANIGVLDYLQFAKTNATKTVESSQNDQQVREVDVSQESSPTPAPTTLLLPTATLNAKVKDSCYPFSCIDLIRQATASVSQRADTNSFQSTGGGTKESYIPFGGGQGQNDQYEDVPGLQAYINPSLYTNISSVTFEASLRIPTANGRAYVRLYNATDNQPVYSSEVSMEGSTSKLLISPPFSLPSGNKLYKIQLKSTLRAPAVLDQSRIHIISQ